MNNKRRKKTKPLREIRQQLEVDIRALKQRKKNLTFHKISSVRVIPPYPDPPTSFDTTKVNKENSLDPSRRAVIVCLLCLRNPSILRRHLTAEVSKMLSTDVAANDTVGGFEIERKKIERERQREGVRIYRKGTCAVIIIFFFGRSRPQSVICKTKTNKIKPWKHQTKQKQNVGPSPS